jgi:hypothetical protein
VDRAWANHRQQAVILAMKDALDVPARLVDDLCRLLVDRELLLERSRRCHLLDIADTQVVCFVLH